MIVQQIRPRYHRTLGHHIHLIHHSLLHLYHRITTAGRALHLHLPLLHREHPHLLDFESMVFRPPHLNPQSPLYHNYLLHFQHLPLSGFRSLKSSRIGIQVSILHHQHQNLPPLTLLPFLLQVPNQVLEVLHMQIQLMERTRMLPYPFQQQR